MALFAGVFTKFYPTSKPPHPLQTEFELSQSSQTKTARRPLPFFTKEDPSGGKGDVNSLENKMIAAGISFSFKADIDEENRATYESHCAKAVERFFEYIEKEDAHGSNKMERFETILGKLSSGSGGYNGVPMKNFIIAPPGEMEGLSISNLKTDFYWNGDPAALFKTLESLEGMNLPQSGTYKHYPLLAIPGEETALMRAQIQTYLERYGPSLDSTQRERIEKVLSQTDDKMKIPKTLNCVWFNSPNDIALEDVENLATFLQRMPEWKSVISTNNVDSVNNQKRGYQEKKKTDGEWNSQIVTALEKMTAVNDGGSNEFFDEEFFSRAGIREELKTKIRDAIKQELKPESPTAKSNAQAASDFFRLCTLLLRPGLYMDIDSNVPKKLPDLYAPFGIQMAFYAKPDRQKPSDTNQFIATSDNEFAREFLETVLEKMVVAYEKNPDLSKLIRSGTPDARVLDSLRLNTLKSYSFKKRVECVVKGGMSAKGVIRKLDKDVMNSKAAFTEARRHLTLLIGNQMLETAKQLYGEHALEQLPDALGSLGKLWQNGYFNAMSAIKWDGGNRKEYTPTKYGKPTIHPNDSVASLRSVDKDAKYPDNLVVDLPSSPYHLSFWRTR